MHVVKSHHLKFDEYDGIGWLRLFIYVAGFNLNVIFWRLKTESHNH